MFLRVRSIETRQRLDRLDPGQDLVHVHRVQQWLVVPGLELVGTNEEPIRVLLDLVGDPPGREAIEGCLTGLHPAILVLAREGDDGPMRTLEFQEILPDRMVILDRALDAARHHHRACLATNLVERQHLFVEVVHHDLGLEPDGVIVTFHVAAQLFPGALGVKLGDLPRSS